MSHIAGVLQRMDVQDVDIVCQDIALEVTPEAKNLLADEGYDPSFGARPLKRAIIRLVETPVSRQIIEGAIPPQSTLVIDKNADGLTFTKK